MRSQSPQAPLAPISLSEADAGRGGRLLADLLTSLASDLPTATGVALSIHDADTASGTFHVKAGWGCGGPLTELQQVSSGPTAAATRQTVITNNIWDDKRWPQLTLATVWTRQPNQYKKLSAVRGMAALPISRESRGCVVLSVALTSPVDSTTLPMMERYTPLMTSAVAAVGESVDNSQRADAALEMLQSRAAIEQAKGIVMSVRRCDAEQAWLLLRGASTQLNVKVRNLAVALIEHLGETPAEQPADPVRRIVASLADRKAASGLWQALHNTPSPKSQQAPLPQAGRYTSTGNAIHAVANDAREALRVNDSLDHGAFVFDHDDQVN